MLILTNLKKNFVWFFSVTASDIHPLVLVPIDASCLKQLLLYDLPNDSFLTL